MSVITFSGENAVHKFSMHIFNLVWSKWMDVGEAVMYDKTTP